MEWDEAEVWDGVEAEAWASVFGALPLPGPMLAGVEVDCRAAAIT
jgi:hypothetical protein